MGINALNEDLLEEFREERKMIREQVDLLVPLGTSLRKPAAQRLINNTLLILLEILCFLLFFGGIALLIKMHEYYPFKIIADIYYNPELKNKLGENQLDFLIVAIYAITGIATLFILIIGIMAERIRRKNVILHQAGKSLKTIVGQHLLRKAAIEIIEQRHWVDISGIELNPESTNQSDINDVRNPGYGE